MQYGTARLIGNSEEVHLRDAFLFPVGARTAPWPTVIAVVSSTDLYRSISTEHVQHFLGLCNVIVLHPNPAWNVRAAAAHERISFMLCQRHGESNQRTSGKHVVGQMNFFHSTLLTLNRFSQAHASFVSNLIPVQLDALTGHTLFIQYVQH
jgi:hypothetical protein